MIASYLKTRPRPTLETAKHAWAQIISKPAAFTRRNHPIRIAVVECDPLRFEGFTSVFRSKREFKLISATVIDLVQQPSTDLVLLATPGTRPLFERMVQLTAAYPDLRILVTGAGVEQPDFILKALALGVKGCIDENASATDFIRAVRVVHEGLVWAQRRVCSTFIDLFTSSKPSPAPERGAIFTDREKEVIQMLIQGRSNREIGEALAINERTVKGHLARLMRKSGARNRVELSLHAIAREMTRVN
jgi:DNA-binding NarL/FixJ family response regulator